MKTKFVKCNFKLPLFLLIIILFAHSSNASTSGRRPKGRGTYDEYFKNRDFPFTFIIPNGITTNVHISNVKQELLRNTKTKFLLSFIYERYNSLSSSGFNRDQTNEKSLKAKLAAFIYMIGLKYNFSTTKVDSLPSFGHADREQYANEARSNLKNIEVKG